MANMNKPLGEQLGWSLLDSSYPYESQWFKLRKDILARAGQGQGTYVYIEHPGSVFVVPLTTDQHILLIHSYRFTIDAWCWEVPAGTIAGRQGLSPEVVALQELEEETGATCRILEHLGKFYLGNGYAHHYAHFFLALDVRRSSDIRLDAFEQITEIASFPIDEIKRMLRDGAINDGDSAFTLLLALNRLASDKSL